MSGSTGASGILPIWPAPPYEWVSARIPWSRELPRKAVSASVAVGFVALLELYPWTATPSPAWGFVSLLALFGGMVLTYHLVDALYVRWIPTELPRLGISPLGLAIDGPVVEERVPWERAALLDRQLLILPKRLGWVRSYSLSERQAVRARHLRPVAP
ncbi:MAG: hypothetical protein L3K01_09630 [Thermoplasmata archaeon]|nr:hypothetical protein [Thermoplasmata archaeon]